MIYLEKKKFQFLVRQDCSEKISAQKSGDFYVIYAKKTLATIVCSVTYSILQTENPTNRSKMMCLCLKPPNIKKNPENTGLYGVDIKKLEYLKPQNNKE